MIIYIMNGDEIRVTICLDHPSIFIEDVERVLHGLLVSQPHACDNIESHLTLVHSSCDVGDTQR